MERIFHCPRCKNKKIIDYGDSFDCPICNQEFEKKDFDLYDEEDILSVEEKKAVADKIFERTKK
jgi:uncharacterized Zn finger protein (UPF0148 family)